MSKVVYEDQTMNSTLPRDPCPEFVARESGVTLVEVLVAIFIMGVGLLALLTLFPLGALDMAQAIKDDRAAAIAADAVAFSQEAEDVVLRTRDFVYDSLQQRSVDPDTVTKLREEYERLGLNAENIELQITDLQSVLPQRLIRRHTKPLLTQLRSIQRQLARVVKLFSLLEHGKVDVD
jgi:prepilin-type N-terminal cleavage/methylation domain-containing protein